MGREVTPLMLAAEINEVHIAKILLKYGASVFAKDDKGWSMCFLIL